MDIFRLSSSVKDLKSFNLWQSLAAELLGTFILVFVGFGSGYGNHSPVKLGLAFGLAGAVAIYCFGPISGGHINPAVSFGLLIARQISLIRFVFYSIVQVLGATLGFACIMLVTNGNVLEKSILIVNITKVPGQPYLENPHIIEIFQEIQSSFLRILCELVITYILVFTVMRMAVEKSRTESEKGLAALIIGISITIGVYCGMHISGGSMNPAASLGSYFFTRKSGVMIHIIGPLIGAFLAGITYQLLFTSKLSAQHIKGYLCDKNFENSNSVEKEKETDELLSKYKKNEIEEENVHDFERGKEKAKENLVT